MQAAETVLAAEMAVAVEATVTATTAKVAMTAVAKGATREAMRVAMLRRPR